MNVFFDERCLLSCELNDLLAAWRQVGRIARSNGQGVNLFLDSWAVRTPEFLVRFNSLRAEFRTLLKPVLFGSELFADWRQNQRAGFLVCRLEIEAIYLTNCGICEAYEHRAENPQVMILGGAQSSFTNRNSIIIERVDPPSSSRSVVCGTDIGGFTRAGVEWEALLVQYDLGLSRPPRDNETALGHFPNRFFRVGRYERHGRRQVYRENASGRLFYVDNLHFGEAAHLEVFDGNEDHLGIADLNGHVDASKNIPGRRIKW